MEEKQSSAFRAIIYSFPMIIVFSIVAFMLLFSVISMIGKYTDVRHKKSVARADLENLKKREMMLGDQVKSLDTSWGQEMVIREKFPVAKEGEQVIMIVKSDPPPPVKDVSFLASFKALFRKKQ